MPLVLGALPHNPARRVLPHTLLQHVWEISKALGWAPLNASRDQAYAHLNERVPGAVAAHA